MALKFSYDTKEAVPAELRAHATEKDGKFVLQFEGEHPDTTKIKEMRETNVRLLKDAEKFKDIDPAVVAADRAKLTELEKAKPHERITALEAENTALKAQASAAEASASRTKLRAGLASKVLAAGVRPEATEIAVDKLEADFVINGEVVTAKPGLFSSDRPGELRTPEESLQMLSRSMGFIFKESGGSGSGGSGSGGGSGDGKTVIRNPSPQEIGRYASDVVAGRVRFEHDG